MAGKVNIATLNIVIAGDAGPANAALGDLERQAQRMPKILDSLNPVRAGTERDTKKYLQAVNQLSYGVEDFLAVIGTTGFSGAMRGASNNISMAARTLSGPFLGAVVGIGAAVGSILLPKLWEWVTANDAVTKSLEERTEAQQKAAEAFSERVEKEAERVDEDRAPYRTTSPSELHAMVEKRSRAVEKAGEKAKIVERDYQDALNKTEGIQRRLNRAVSEEQIIKEEIAKGAGLSQIPAGDAALRALATPEQLNRLKNLEARIETLKQEREDHKITEKAISEEYEKQSRQLRRAQELHRQATKRAHEVEQPSIEDFFAAESKSLDAQMFEGVAEKAKAFLQKAAADLNRFWEERKQIRQEESKAEEMRWKLEVDAIEDVEARKAKAIENELKLNNKRIDSLKKLSQTERDELKALSREKAQADLQSLLNDQEKKLFREAEQRIESRSIDPSSRNSLEGSRTINSMMNRHLAGGVAKDEAAEAIDKFHRAVKPILEAINRKLTATGQQPLTLNLTGGP